MSALSLLLLKTVLIIFGRLIRVEGRERFQNQRYPVIFALNHNNYAETLLIPCALMYLSGRKISFLIHWMFKDFPFLGWLMRRIDPVWVWGNPVRSRFLKKKKKPPRTISAVHGALDRCRRGICLGIFPEGTRNHHPYFLLPGRRGLGEIALRCRIPVVPVGIDFPFRARQGRIPALGKMILRVGEPMEFDAELNLLDAAEKAGGAEAPAARKAFRRLSRLVTEKVMRSIAPLCGKKTAAAEQAGVVPP